MSAFLQRIRKPSFHSKIRNTADLIPLFRDGMNLGWSGFTSVGYPKVLPTALADHVEKNELQGKLRFNQFVGASVGKETEDRWAALNMIDRRFPYQSGKNLQKGINSGRIRFADKHLSGFALDLTHGFYTKDRPRGARPLDIGMIEAVAITEDGGIIPGASLGASVEVAKLSDKLIIEVNTALPEEWEGMHDVYLPKHPPHTLPIPITHVRDRIGSPTIKVDFDRIIGIVESNRIDQTPATEEANENSRLISQHILDFFQHEVNQGRMPRSLHPIQSGIGQVANAVIAGLTDGPFLDMNVWTEVIQDSFLNFFDNGKLNFASTTSVHLSPDGFKRFYADMHKYRDKILLRCQQVANSPELIRRFGCIAMNTPVEFDIYGHANSTCVAGSRMLNGIGGSGDFLRNSKLSIMHTPSARPSKTDPLGISCVVPMCSHVDHTEHDLDVFVTEQGLADLRGLSPKERAKEIIDKCAHPAYKPILRDYLETATQQCLKKGTAHEPHMLSKVFKMYENLEKNGTMRITSWD